MSIERAFVTGGSGFVGRGLIAALRQRGAAVAALARSTEAADAVRRAGADAVSGDLEESAALVAGITGCDVVFHAAARQGDAGRFADFHRVNVQGTSNVIRAARDAGARCLVYVSTEAVLAGKDSISNADETTPKPPEPLGAYARTKSMAEDLVLAADSGSLRTVVIRPRLVWGKGDSVHLPRLADDVRRGRFYWIDGGRYLTSTCHVRNLAAALMLAAEDGHGGQVYFITDGEPIEYRAFVTSLLRTQGLTPPNRSIPASLARPAARAGATLWGALGLKSAPPLTILAVRLLGEEVTVDDGKARRELGYQNVVSIEHGVAEMTVSQPSAAA